MTDNLHLDDPGTHIDLFPEEGDALLDGETVTAVGRDGNEYTIRVKPFDRFGRTDETHEFHDDCDPLLQCHVEDVLFEYSSLWEYCPACGASLDDASVNESKGEDTERFTHAGLECKIVQTGLGHWCGYVKRPESVEPVRWISDYDSKHGEIVEADVDVWGGITYGPDDDGWVGFDDGHSASLVDHRDHSETDRDAVRVETEDLAEQIRSLQSNTDDGGVSGDGV